MNHNSLILWAKIRSANNALRLIKRHMYIHMAVGGLVVIVVAGGGTAFFFEMFRYLSNLEIIGGPLMDRLIGIVFLAFFSMLVFSNLIITLSTSYISREVDFLMAQPISSSAIFRQKLIESIVYSSWAFAVLSLPLFVSMGLARDVTWYFYPLVAILVVPFLVIPAALGSIVTMVVTALVPARRTRLLCIVLGLLSILIAFVLARLMGMDELLRQADQQNFAQIMSILETGSSPLLPSSWMTNGVLALAPWKANAVRLDEFVYWFAMLCATALVLLDVCAWLVPPLYYRGWALSKDTSARTIASQFRWAPLRVFDRLIAPLPSQVRALLSKDMKTFWRDPAQWTQLVILFGLMVIYIANLGSARRYSVTVEVVLAQWKTILALFNLGATCFILSILTTRFIYPMLSLEGRQFWAIGLAPMNRTRIVWQKYVLCVLSALFFSLSLLLLSNHVLQVALSLKILSVCTVILMTFALSSLSIGIGALLPNFREDNPARIANGLGGTLNAILSLLYIGVTVAMLVIPIGFFGSQIAEAWDAWWAWILLYGTAFLLIQTFVIVFPMALGLRKWKRLEF